MYVSTLKGYIVCPAEQRFMLLFTFLKKNIKKKIMVFLSSCKSVQHHAELLNYIDIPVQCIHVSIACVLFVLDLFNKLMDGSHNGKLSI